MNAYGNSYQQHCLIAEAQLGPTRITFGESIKSSLLHHGSTISFWLHSVNIKNTRLCVHLCLIEMPVRESQKFRASHFRRCGLAPPTHPNMF